MAQITFSDKTAMNVNPNIPDENKITDNDMNEIKNVVNANDNALGTMIYNSANATIQPADEGDVATIDLLAGHTYIICAGMDVNADYDKLLMLFLYLKTGTATASFFPKALRGSAKSGGGLEATAFISCQTNCTVASYTYNYDSSPQLFRCNMCAIELK